MVRRALKCELALLVIARRVPLLRLARLKRRAVERREGFGEGDSQLATCGRRWGERRRLWREKPALRR